MVIAGFTKKQVGKALASIKKKHGCVFAFVSNVDGSPRYGKLRKKVGGEFFGGLDWQVYRDFICELLRQNENGCVVIGKTFFYNWTDFLLRNGEIQSAVTVALDNIEDDQIKIAEKAIEANPKT